MSIYFPKLDLSKIKSCSRASRRSPGNAVSRSSVPQQSSFPVKLHQLLTKVEEKDFDDVVCWNPDGRSFQVHDQQRFIEEVISDPSCGLRQSKYKSFSRQLNLYGFKRVSHGPQEGSYKHPWFVRDNIELCKRMTRKHRSDEPTELDVIMEQSRRCPPPPKPEVISRRVVSEDTELTRVMPPRDVGNNVNPTIQASPVDDIVLPYEVIEPIPFQAPVPVAANTTLTQPRGSFVRMFSDKVSMDELHRLYESTEQEADEDETDSSNSPPQPESRVPFVGKHFYYMP